MSTVIPIRPLQADAPRRTQRTQRERPVTVTALAEVQAATAHLALQRDLLIEHLHALQDRFGQLRTDHLAALAQRLELAQTQVYEVASFYHHFDIVREDAQGAYSAPPRLTVRVCESLSCNLAGSAKLLERLPQLLDADVRVIPAPCVGRCEQAPVAVVHQHPLSQASVEAVVDAVQQGVTTHEPEPYADLVDYRAAGGYRLLEACRRGERDVESVIATLEDAGLRGLGGLGGAGFPAGRKWRLVPRSRRRA